MVLLIDIFSVNKSRGYVNPSLDIIVIELFSTGGCPLEEPVNIAFNNLSALFGVILLSFQYYCGDILVILLFICHF